MEGRRPGRRRESRQVWRLHALRARARRVLRETEAARRRAGRRARSVLQGPRGQPSAHPRLDGVRRGGDAAAGRSHRLALPDRARPAPALGGHPDPGGRQRRRELRITDGQVHRRARHRHGGKRLEAREGRGTGRERGDQLHRHAEVQPAREGADRRPRRGRRLRLRRRDGLGRESREPQARRPARHHRHDLGEPDPVQSRPAPVASADPHGQRHPESTELRRDDAHGAFRRPARRGRADVRSRRRGQGSRGDGRTRFLRQAGPARAVGGMVMGERELTYGEAVKEAIAEEMRRDPRVFLIGEDVAEAGHPFKTLTGLVQEFGTDRIIDTPISEPGYAGIGVGAAMTGMRPIVDVMFGDFITLTMDQMVNQAAKAHYMSGGKIKVPIVFRTTLGAAKMLEEIGISAEVIDPRTTYPLDKQALIDSAKKTSRAIVVDEGYERYGTTAEIASVIAEGAFYHLDAPVKRIGAMDVPVPFSPVLEDLTVPSEKTVFETARALCGKA